AEDGIRDFHVTGVQTCALPISLHHGRLSKLFIAAESVLSGKPLELLPHVAGFARVRRSRAVVDWPKSNVEKFGVERVGPGNKAEIGRASGRERESNKDGWVYVL